MSSGDRTNGEWSFRIVFLFTSFGGFEILGASNEFLVVFTGRGEVFLSPPAVFKSYILEELVVELRDL